MSRVRRKRSGFSLIELLIVIEVVMILAGLAVPNMIATRRSADEASAISSLRLIATAEHGYRGKNNTYGTLSQLNTAGLISPVVGSAIGPDTAKSNFYFAINNATATQWWATAYRAHATTNDRQFYIDETGIMFAAQAGSTFPTSDTSGTAPNINYTQVGS